MKRILLAAALLALASCASAPSYQPAASASSQGYSEQMISKDRYRVRYTGSASMKSPEVQDYALMRAAQLTLEQGSDWFEVVSRDTDKDTRQRSSIETDFGPDYVVTRNCGLLGCTSQATPVPSRAQVQTVETRTVYEHSMEIVMGKGEPLAGGSSKVYDAKDTLQTLRGRLNS